MPLDIDILGVKRAPLWAFAYVSAPTDPFSDRDLSDLLLSARRFNAAHGVTGKLVVLEEGHRVVRFAQWVEGPRAPLDACVERILDDPRHTILDVVHHERGAARRFPSWDMAIQPASTLEFASSVTELTTVES